MIKRQYYPYLALIVAFLLWALFKPKAEKIVTPDHQPSSIAEQAASEHYDQTGFNDYRVYAEKMTNYPEAQITLFEQPKVIVYSLNPETKHITTWQLTSDKGTLENKHKLLLSGAVLVENLSKDQIVQTMSTESATLMLDSKEISTKQTVTWTGPQVQQQGTGMWASMKTEEMKLFSNIKAVYLNETN